MPSITRDDVRELAAREHVFLDEVADAAAEALCAERVVRDAVVQHEPAGLQDPADLAEIAREARDADVLEHADARDLVVRLVVGQVEVVEQLDLDAVPRARARRSRAFTWSNWFCDSVMPVASTP